MSGGCRDKGDRRVQRSGCHEDSGIRTPEGAGIRVSEGAGIKVL